MTNLWCFVCGEKLTPPFWTLNGLGYCWGHEVSDPEAHADS